MAENLQVSSQCRSYAPCKVAETEVEYKWAVESVKRRTILGKLKAQGICPPICVCNVYECVSLCAKGRKKFGSFSYENLDRTCLECCAFFQRSRFSFISLPVKIFMICPPVKIRGYCTTLSLFAKKRTP